MGLVILASNFLVQFPVLHFGLQDILTYGAFTYPITFLVNDLSNKFYGPAFARKVIFIGFFFGIFASCVFTVDEIDFITFRIVIGSAVAFMTAQLLDIKVFDILRNRIWFVPPFVSSVMGSIIDTIIFFSITFYGTDSPWLTLAIGDLGVKLFVALIVLVPFRYLTFKTS